MAITIAGSNPESNPLDGFKNIIAEKLANISGADPALIHRSLEAPRSPDHGDFAVAIPKLRVKGNPAALAKEWAGKVWNLEEMRGFLYALVVNIGGVPLFLD